MKKSKFTDSQIMDALKRVEAGVVVPELCREIGIALRSERRTAVPASPPLKRQGLTSISFNR